MVSTGLTRPATPRHQHLPGRNPRTTLWGNVFLLAHVTPLAVMPAFIDLTGQKFGRLTVLRRAPDVKKGQPRWECLCECGNPSTVDAGHLRSGATKSCGCIKPQPKNIIGQKFGLLTVVSLMENHTTHGPRWLCRCECGGESNPYGKSLASGRTRSCGCRLLAEDLTGRVFSRLTVLRRVESPGKPRWECRCECGKITTVQSNNLKSGSVKSCGCYIRDLRITHGHSVGKNLTPVYKTWLGMINRVAGKKERTYKYYKSRGITVCERWQTFDNFFEDMGDRPFPNASLERKDNSQGYSPENCVWTNQKEQMRNTRRSRLLTFNGKTKCVAEWSDVTEISQ